MDVLDYHLSRNRDWDPNYLDRILSEDFYDFSELWNTGCIKDMDLVKEVEKIERYSPIVEDISLEDDVLCSAVQRIENE